MCILILYLVIIAQPFIGFNKNATYFWWHLRKLLICSKHHIFYILKDVQRYSLVIPDNYKTLGKLTISIKDNYTYDNAKQYRNYEPLTDEK